MSNTFFWEGRKTSAPAPPDGPVHYMPRCLRTKVACGETPTIPTLNLSKLLSFCYCAVETNSRTIRWQVSQPASAGKGPGM